MPGGGSKFQLDKQPSEIRAPSFDFHKRLGSSETISTVAITEIDLTTGTTPVATILEGSAQIQTGVQTDSKVVQQIKAGVDGTKYKIKVLATTSDGNKLQADLVMIVNENVEA